MKIETRLKILQRHVERIPDYSVEQAFEQVIEILKELVKDA